MREEDALSSVAYSLLVSLSYLEITTSTCYCVICLDYGLHVLLCV